MENSQVAIRSILEHFPNNDVFRTAITNAIDFILHNNLSRRPYHNTHHCILVARNALYYTSPDFSILDKTVIGIAGLFHDFGHSGQPLGIKEDRLNIKKALSGLNQFKLKCPDSMLKVIPWNSITDIILSTEAVSENGHILFPKSPSVLGEAIRDADVTMLYWADGRDTLDGLAQEMWHTYDLDFKDKSVQFFNNVVLYTEKAKKLRLDSKDEVEKWAVETTTKPKRHLKQ